MDAGARGAGLDDQVAAFVGMHGEIADLGGALHGVAAAVPLEAVDGGLDVGLPGLEDVHLPALCRKSPGRRRGPAGSNLRSRRPRAGTATQSTSGRRFGPD